jgi:hypothetical protein
MPKSLLLLPLLGISALMCSCVTYPYPGPGYAAGRPVYEPGYVAAYGEPLYVYGGMNYYYHGGRYCYLQHGRPIYVARVPYGAAHYHGPSYTLRSGAYQRNHSSTHPYTKAGWPPPGRPPYNLNVQGRPPHNLNVQGQPPRNLNVQGQPPRNLNVQKTGQGGGNTHRQGATQSHQIQKKKVSDKQ